MSLNNERIERELRPFYEPQVRRMDAVLARFNPEQLEVIADFLERVMGDPYGASDVAELGPVPTRSTHPVEAGT